jgi:hypothetical protein
MASHGLHEIVIISAMRTRVGPPWIASTIAFGAGLAVGWLVLGRARERNGPAQTAALSIAPAMDWQAAEPRPARTSRPDKDDAPGPLESHERQPSARAVDRAPAAITVGGSTQELEAHVRSLEKELAETKDRLAQLGGKPLTEPPDLPDRFKQTALLDAVRGAFREVNPKAEVTSIDCTEYPCIAYGSGLTLDQLKAINSTAALRPYGNDDVSNLIFDGTVGVIATPKNDPTLGEDAEQRVLFRFHQMAMANKQH